MKYRIIKITGGLIPVEPRYVVKRCAIDFQYFKWLNIWKYCRTGNKFDNIIYRQDSVYTTRNIFHDVITFKSQRHAQTFIDLHAEYYISHRKNKKIKKEIVNEITDLETILKN